MARRNNKKRFTVDQSTRGGMAVRGGEFAEEARMRALQDAKGVTLRQGAFYTAKCPDGQAWEKRRALIGRVDQIELVYAGQIRHTTGETLLRHDLRWLRGI